MEDDLVTATITDTSDFTVLGLFLKADVVVKSVMLVLLVGSVWSWAIMYEKIRMFRRLYKITNEFESDFWSGRSIEKIYNSIDDYTDNPLANVFKAAMSEIKKSKKGQYSNMADRIFGTMKVHAEQEIEAMQIHLSYLATVGSTAPFIGLFGTVWGVMNSFQSIAVSKNTSLAVVAPGIAEALFATALGLLAAVPAVVAYNFFSANTNKYTSRLDRFIDEFMRIFLRGIDKSG